MLKNLFYKKNSDHIFASLLDALQVKYTHSYSTKLYQEHPNKDNLLGLSQMLSEYNIENQGYRIEDKNEIIGQLETPFVAFVGNDFATVKKVTPEKVEYKWKDKTISRSLEEFIHSWSGVVLLVEPSENAIEPHYKENHKEELIAELKSLGILFSVFLFLALAGIKTGALLQSKFLIAIAINLIGVFIGYQLISKQLKVEGSYADKICSLFLHQGDCNNVLESDAAKIMGFSWSEIGLGYFVANILFIICFPLLYPYVALINIVSLPYTFWSVWYQRSVAKQWCPLCLFVLGVLWLFCIYNILTGMVEWPVWSIISLLLTGCVYAIPILLLNRLLPQIAKAQTVEVIHQELNSLKADETIFISLLQAKPRYPTDRSMGILWGNPEAKNTITIITNPHCNPCARMHERLEDLVKNNPEDYCFQYILTSFNKELEKSSQLFIAMYQQKSPSDYLSILTDWYNGGKNRIEDFYIQYPFDPEDKRMLSEFQKHKDWISENKITATPTILFNGYELPEKYKVEDLKHFCSVSVL